MESKSHPDGAIHNNKSLTYNMGRKLGVRTSCSERSCGSGRGEFRSLRWSWGLGHLALSVALSVAVDYGRPNTLPLGWQSTNHHKVLDVEENI